MERILCPVDLKPDTLNALEAAAHLVAAHQAQLVLLHVFTEDEYEKALNAGSGDLARVDEWQAQQLQALEKLCETMRELVPGLNCLAMLRQGSVISTILDEAKILKASLIVMGSHGVHDIAQAMEGNHPVKVIERSPCPMLCVPTGAAFVAPARVVYGSRLKAEDPDCLQRLLAVLHPFGSRIEVVHIGEADEPGMQKWQDHQALIKSYVPSEKIRFHYLISDDRVYQDLDAFVSQVNGSMLVLLTHQRNFFSRLFEKSVFKQITYFSDYPVLVFLEDHLNQASKDA